MQKVAERAVQIWPNVEKFVASFEDPKKASSTASFVTVKAACEDPLTTTKLEFFISVAKQLQPFLKRFQTDATMAPFLGQQLKEVMMGLMGPFLKQEVLSSANTLQKLASLDPKDKKNQMLSKHIVLGLAAKQSLKNVTDKKAVSDLKVLAFKNECLTLLAALTSKMLEKGPP